MSSKLHESFSFFVFNFIGACASIASFVWSLISIWNNDERLPFGVILTASLLVLFGFLFFLRRLLFVLGGSSGRLGLYPFVRLLTPFPYIAALRAITEFQEALVKYGEDRSKVVDFNDGRFCEIIVRPLLKCIQCGMHRILGIDTIVDLKMFSEGIRSRKYRGNLSNPEEDTLNSRASLIYSDDLEQRILEWTDYQLVDASDIAALMEKHPVGEAKQEPLVNSAFSTALRTSHGCWIGNDLTSSRYKGVTFYTNSPNIGKHYNSMGVFLISRAFVQSSSSFEHYTDRDGVESTVYGMLVVKTRHKAALDTKLFQFLGTYYANRLYFFLKKSQPGQLNLV